VVAPVSWTKISQCRACGHGFSGVFCDLGSQPLANAYVRPQASNDDDQHIPLRAVICSACRLVQLEHLASSEAIFCDYAYLSSMSTSFVEHARAFVQRVARIYRPQFVVEIASNDGYLLQNFVRSGTRCLGVEPAANLAAFAQEKGVETITRFFGASLAEEISQARGQPDLIIANNVLAHVPDVNDFVAGLKRLLASGGLISIEFPHLVAMVRGLQFDTIYHEHYAYYSLLAVEHLLHRHGLAVADVEQLSIHGGSLRLFIRHAEDVTQVTQAVVALRRQEHALGLEGENFYRDFDASVQALLESFREFLIKADHDGKSIAAYGAAAKGNTFLNAIGEAARLISCVADVNLLKQGHLLPGTHIPIVSPQDMAARQPDFILVLPWNLATEIEHVLAGLGLNGKTMVTAIPHLKCREIGA
jgi:2-polyprenyl-3-methyl-5-hydroxy-6-metoxy-1,4-benzoquinol methylase